MVLRVKGQKASLNRGPIAYTAGGGGLVLTQHQSGDTEMDGQRNTRDRSSGRPGALLEISYLTGECSTSHFTIIFGGLGRSKSNQ